MAFDADGFNRTVSLPPELKISHIRESIEHVEERAAELIDIYFEQANVFSGIVGIMGVQAVHALSPYKKHKHPDVAQQRFRDLSLRGRLNPPPCPGIGIQGFYTALGTAIPLQPLWLVHRLALRRRSDDAFETA